MTDASQVESSFTFGPLYDLLKKKFPEHRTETGRFDVPRFAQDMNMSHEGVYKWLRNNKISPGGVDKIVALSQQQTYSNEDDGPAKIEDFLTFVFV